jgi:hypothetical protein
VNTSNFIPEQKLYSEKYEFFKEIIRERTFSMLTQEQQFVFAKSPEAAESQGLFGPPALLPAESPAEYWRLHSLLQAELAPADVIEKIWLRDLVDLQWEVLRWRRLSNEFLSSSKYDGLDKILSSLQSYDSSEGELKRNWMRRDPAAVAEVSNLLNSAGLSDDAILAQTLAVKLDAIDRIDRMTFQAERRRDLAIQQIERRRGDLAARARAAVKRAGEEKIEDVEFKELSEPEAPKKATESEAVRTEEQLQAPAAAEEPKASDRTEDAEEHTPSEAGDHGRGDAMELEAPAIAADPEGRLPSAECEHALEEPESAEVPNIAEDYRKRLTLKDNDHATDPDAG